MSKIISNNKLTILFISIILTSTFLRGPIVSVGPISDILENALNITNTEFGLITTLPLLVFALSSTTIPFLNSKFGLINTIIASSVLIIIGSFLRSIDNYYILLLGTIIIGFGISIGNVLIPAIIKEYAQEKKAIYTSFYLSTQNLFASFASGFALYIAIVFSWQGLMLIWIFPATLALISWLSFKKLASQEKSSNSSINTLAWPVLKELLRSKYAWSITLIMGLQSILYFTYSSFLPKIIGGLNHSDEVISFLVAAFQLIPLPSMFLVPILVKKMKESSYILLFGSVLLIIGLIIIQLYTSVLALFIAIVGITIGASNCFAWVVATITNSTKDSQQASSLSAMSQTIGYLMAASGPFIAGLLVDITNNTSSINLFTLLIGILISIVSIIIYLKRDEFKFE